MIETAAQRDLTSFYARNATLGSSDRYRTATKAQAYYLGLQYEHLKDWHAPDTKLRDRKPKIIEPLFAKAINRLASFIWGGHRFPRPIVGATRKLDEPEDPREIGPRLLPEDAAVLTTFLGEAVRKGLLRSAAKQATREALVTTSVALIVGTVGGHLSVHVEDGKHCTPTFSPTNPRELEKLEIVYQHQREEPTEVGSVRKRWFWYRRTIDAMRDVVYREVPVQPGRTPEWIEDPDKTRDHSLGFCPARWWRTLPDGADAIDGRPIISPQLYPLLDAVNYTLSQRDRAVSYGCDPQPIRTGVLEPDRENLNKTPGSIWDIPADGDFKFAEITGTGVVRASEHLDDLGRRFYEAVRVVLLDPKTLSGDISGRVLEILHESMVSLASDLRGDLGDEGYCGLCATTLRVVATELAAGRDVWIPGAHKAADILTRSQLAGPWIDPPITLAWPPFFTESETEKTQRFDRVIKASGATRVITTATATREVADIFHVEDAEAEREAAQAETDAKRPPAFGGADAKTGGKEADDDRDVNPENVLQRPTKPDSEPKTDGDENREPSK